MLDKTASRGLQATSAQCWQQRTTLPCPALSKVTIIASYKSTWIPDECSPSCWGLWLLNPSMDPLFSSHILWGCSPLAAAFHSFCGFWVQSLKTWTKATALLPSRSVCEGSVTGGGICSEKSTFQAFIAQQIIQTSHIKQFNRIQVELYSYLH